MKGPLVALLAPNAPPPGVDAVPHRSGAAVGSALAAGAGLGWIVAADGSTPWRVVRLAVVAGLTWLLIRPDSDVRATRRLTFALASGLGALGVGVGMAVPHLAKAGWSTTAIAGLLCLGGGAGLLAVATAGMFRPLGRPGRVALVPAVVALVLVSVWVIGQAVAVTNVPRTAVGNETPADRGLAFADVVLRTEDGVTLSGWYIPSTKGAAVVVLHGAGSTRSSVLDHAVVLARNGYGVLAFDARGHGRSGGRAMDFGWYGDEDLAAAVTFLHDRPDVDLGRIAAVGLSMGGEEAIGAAASDPDLRAVVAEGATNRTAADKAWLSDHYGLRGTIQEGIDRLMYGVTDLLTAADRPISLRAAVARAAPRPFLLIAGGDVPDEAPAADFISNGAPASVTVWEVPDTGHTDALTTHPTEWEQRVVTFLDGALAPG